MAPSVFARVLVLASLAVTLSGCGLTEGDGRRFEALAQRVAEISVPMTPEGAPAGVPSAAEAGLRPALPAPLRVEVMDPHDLWDARDGLLRQAAVDVTAPAVEQAARVLARSDGLRPGLPPATPRQVATIQLGAFSSEAAARAAWARVSQGPAASALSGLSPAFETVKVNGRDFTRLKVGPIPAEAATRLCRAAQVADPWCGRAG